MFSGIFRKNYFLGIDFGTASMKVVELKVHGGMPKLSNYGIVRMDVDKNVGKKITFQQGRQSYFRSLIKKANFKAESSFVAMPAHNGLVALIQFPQMKESELAQAIQYEAHKYVPAKMEDVSLSWDVVRKADEEGKMFAKSSAKGEQKSMEVLLVAALKKDVEAIEQTIAGSDVDIEAIELETFSLSRSIVGDRSGTFLIIDIGYKVCNFVLVRDGVVRVNRNIDVGGSEITKTISDSMNISLERAERLKKDKGRDFFHQRELSLTFPSIEMIITEAQRIIDVYKEKDAKNKIDAILLSGGSSEMNGLKQYLSEQLEIPTELGDPWKNIEVENQVEPFVKEIGGTFSVALGAALRGVEEYKRI